MKKQIKLEATNQKINRDIYGHFIEHLGNCIYEGLWVGEDSSIPNKNGLRIDVVEALKNLSIPVLRWPGGCFADEYHWKDGIGPKHERKQIVNNNWGGLTEDNSFGTHEFFELVEQLGCEAYVNVNVGSGTVKEMQDWIEYMTADQDSPMSRWRRYNGRDKPWKLKYIGIGNESWGCGGFMRPEYYSDVYRRYQSYVRNYNNQDMYKIASGPNIDDYNWTEVVTRNTKDVTDAISLHHYALVTKPGETRPAFNFPVEEWYSLVNSALFMDELITKHKNIMSSVDKEGKVKLIVDEWGSWYTPEEGTNPGFLHQRNTIRDAMVASITLNIFHKHSDIIQMANIAQMINVLQSVIHTNGSDMFLTPTYYVFEMYKDHQDAFLLPIESKEQEFISETASIKNGEITLSVCNYHHENSKQIEYGFDKNISLISAEIIYGNELDSHNTFENKHNVEIKSFNSYMCEGNTVTMEVPERSVLTLRFKIIG